MPSILSRSDYVDFLLHMKFGSEVGLAACLKEAYGDLKRTVRGIAKLPNAEALRARADQELSIAFEEVRSMNSGTQKDFDAWHRQTCDRLVLTYKEFGYPSFEVGQSQKWLNMAFKYIFLTGEDQLPGFKQLYDLCHVPLDNRLIAALSQYGFQPLPNAWSKLDDYDVYLDRQQWVRNRFDLVPMDVEFLLWMGRPIS